MESTNHSKTILKVMSDYIGKGMSLSHLDAELFCLEILRELAINGYSVQFLPRISKHAAVDKFDDKIKDIQQKVYEDLLIDEN